MHNTEPVLENETHKILWGFEIQTDYLISARPLDLVIVNKKKEKKENLLNSGLCRFSADHRLKLKESEKRDKYLDVARGLK